MLNTPVLPDAKQGFLDGLRGADIIRLLNRLLRFRVHVVECVIYNGGQRIGAVVFHLSIYVHGATR